MAFYEIQISRLVREFKVLEIEAESMEAAKKAALKNDDGSGYCDGKVGRRRVEDGWPRNPSEDDPIENEAM